MKNPHLKFFCQRPFNWKEECKKVLVCLSTLYIEERKKILLLKTVRQNKKKMLPEICFKPENRFQN